MESWWSLVKRGYEIVGFVKLGEFVDLRRNLSPLKKDCGQ